MKISFIYAGKKGGMGKVSRFRHGMLCIWWLSGLAMGRSFVAQTSRCRASLVALYALFSQEECLLAGEP